MVLASSYELNSEFGKVRRAQVPQFVLAGLSVLALVAFHVILVAAITAATVGVIGLVVLLLTHSEAKRLLRELSYTCGWSALAGLAAFGGSMFGQIVAVPSSTLHDLISIALAGSAGLCLWLIGFRWQGTPSVLASRGVRLPTFLTWRP